MPILDFWVICSTSYYSIWYLCIFAKGVRFPLNIIFRKLNESQSWAQSLSAEQRERERHCAQVFSWPACNNTKAFVQDNSSKRICLQRFFYAYQFTKRQIEIPHISTYLASKNQRRIWHRGINLTSSVCLKVIFKTIALYLWNIVLLVILLYNVRHKCELQANFNNIIIDCYICNILYNFIFQWLFYL